MPLFAFLLMYVLFISCVLNVQLLCINASSVFTNSEFSKNCLKLTELVSFVAEDCPSFIVAPDFGCFVIFVLNIVNRSNDTKTVFRYCLKELVEQYYHIR